jgi:hypothetical protein
VEHHHLHVLGELDIQLHAEAVLHRCPERRKRVFDDAGVYVVQPPVGEALAPPAAGLFVAQARVGQEGEQGEYDQQYQPDGTLRYPRIQAMYVSSLHPQNMSARTVRMAWVLRLMGIYGED